MSGAREPRHDMTINSKPLGPLRRSDDMLAKYDWEKGSLIMIVAPWEMGGTNEIWEMVWNKETPVGYHLHHDATETFFLTRGAAMFTVGGQKFLVQPGDMVHIPPYLPHGMEFLEQDTTWLTFFKGVGFFVIQMDDVALRAHLPDKLTDAAFIDDFGDHHDSYMALEPPVPIENASPRALRRKGEWLATHSDANADLYLKVAPWETDNVNQVWEMHMHEGAQVPLHVHYYGWETFFMTKGVSEFTVGEETKVARPGDLVLVPPYSPHTMRILEESTWMCFFRNVPLYESLVEESFVLAQGPGWNQQA